MRGLLFFTVLAVGSFLATLAWVEHSRSSRAADSTLVQDAGASAVQQSPQGVLADAATDGETLAVAKPPLPPEHLAELVETGISADDSEQRSLAILELSEAPVEQLLPALLRILGESRDSRSRLTALAQLMQLPDSPLVRENRLRMLAQLARDEDHFVAEAALSAAATRG